MASPPISLGPLGLFQGILPGEASLLPSSSPFKALVVTRGPAPWNPCSLRGFSGGCSPTPPIFISKYRGLCPQTPGTLHIVVKQACSACSPPIFGLILLNLTQIEFNFISKSSFLALFHSISLNLSHLLSILSVGGTCSPPKPPWPTLRGLLIGRRGLQGPKALGATTWPFLLIFYRPTGGLPFGQYPPGGLHRPDGPTRATTWPLLSYFCWPTASTLRGLPGLGSGAALYRPGLLRGNKPFGLVSLRPGGWPLGLIFTFQRPNSAFYFEMKEIGCF